jgi:hypothetical protein
VALGDSQGHHATEVRTLRLLFTCAFLFDSHARLTTPGGVHGSRRQGMHGSRRHGGMHGSRRHGGVHGSRSRRQGACTAHRRKLLNFECFSF